MSIKFASYVVRSSNGSIDHNATMEKFMGELLSWEEVYAAETAEIGEAVNTVFDRFEGVRVNKPFVIGQVLETLRVSLGLSYGDLAAYQKKVSEYLEDESRFRSCRGKNGGIERIAR
jgi:hypothetical protein